MHATEASPIGSRFLTVWAGQTVSAIGSMVSGIGVAVWVYLETGNAVWLGLLAALSALPPVIIGPLLPLADRLPRRTVMIGADTIAALGSIGALGLAMIGRLEPWHLVIAGFVAGIGTAIQFPAFQAAIPTLVAPSALGRANGLNQFGPALGIVVGPIVATPLIAWKGVVAVLVIDLVTFVVAVCCTFAIRFSTIPVPSSAHDDGTWRALASWLRHDARPVALLLGATAATNGFLALFNVAIVAIATGVSGTAGTGLLFSISGLAMLASSLVLGRTGIPRRRGSALSVALGVMAVGLVVVGLRPSFVVVAIGAMVVLAAAPVLSAIVATSYHEWVPASMQTRVFGLRSAVSRSTEVVGSAVAGILIARVAEPIMDDAGGATIGRVIGSGADRGAALMVVIAGAAVGVVAMWLRTELGDSLDARSLEADTPARVSVSAV